MDEIAQIAVVEDDATIRAILEMALMGAGFVHVRSYERGDDALADIRRRRPDLVLLDVMLPGLDGFAIAKRSSRRLTWSSRSSASRSRSRRRTGSSIRKTLRSTAPASGSARAASPS
jgi:CheY-like chemotaxis protein